MDSKDIDRQCLVRRHNPTRHASNARSPMQVGNGRFAFGADITGLQTFVPFATISEWGWKNDPLPTDVNKEFSGQTWDTHGRSVQYDMPDSNAPEMSQWLIANPNRMNLGRIGLWFGEDRDIKESDLENCTQTLDLWTGTIHSTFNLRGIEVNVEASVHPDMDSLGVKIASPLVQSGQLGVFFDFPYNDGRSKFSAPYVGIWDEPYRHTTVLSEQDKGTRSACFRRHLDDTNYNVRLQWSQENGRIHPNSPNDHLFFLKLSNPSSPFLEFSAHFYPDGPWHESHAREIFNRSAEYWPSYWSSGGAIDLSFSSDSRWRELERRIVLSQYVMAVNARGNYPPQESGLVNLGWYGKFHMEMNWFHSAYLALFNRWPSLYPSLDVYKRFLPSSMERAANQGYRGARWPKMTDPSGRTAPGEINALLIWQQPHPLAFAELDYRSHPTQETLASWKNVVEATADFMSSFVKQNQNELGPPLHVMSENTDPRVTCNPAFEIEYWRFGLDVARKWWKRLGLDDNEEWNLEALLPPLPTNPHDGLYSIYHGIEDMWEKYNWEHPALTGMHGWLPGSASLDLATVRATSEKIWEVWHLDDCWGWDFAVLAMNAARLGQPDRAINFLLNPNLPFDDVGLPDGGSRVPFPYLPACGSLLYAAAFMAAGWDGVPDGLNAPGFPAKGWTVKTEGLSRAL